MTNRLIVAIDTSSYAQAVRWVGATRPHVGMFKIGLEFFCAWGAEKTMYLVGDKPFFLDLKFHDIPTTVARAVKAVMWMTPAMISVHADDPKTIEAVRLVLDEVETRPLLLGVTTLSSSPAGAGVHPSEILGAGADGLICTPHAAAAYRPIFPPKTVLVTPGVRPEGWAADDHVLPCTPVQAVGYGADWIVVGRPITQADNPGEAAGLIAESIKDL